MTDYQPAWPSTLAMVLLAISAPLRDQKVFDWVPTRNVPLRIQGMSYLQPTAYGLSSAFWLRPMVALGPFVVKKGNDFEIRWFTPSVEVDLCGHATLAAAYVLYKYYN